MDIIKEIKDKIINDDQFALKFQYVMKKTLETGVSPRLAFIYKNHKIKKGDDGFYNIYEFGTKRKLYGEIYLQDTAKYIIDNLNSYSKIDYILRIETTLFRIKDKLKFIDYQIQHSKNDVLYAKRELIQSQFYQQKTNYLDLISKLE